MPPLAGPLPTREMISPLESLAALDSPNPPTQLISITLNIVLYKQKKLSWQVS